MSTLLEPGECVRWKHDGGWKVGRVLMPIYNIWPLIESYVVQCPEGVYHAYVGDELEMQPMRAEWEGENR